MLKFFKNTSIYRLLKYNLFKDADQTMIATLNYLFVSPKSVMVGGQNNFSAENCDKD